jgi:hypothetical protein
MIAHLKKKINLMNLIEFSNVYFIKRFKELDNR